MAKLGSKERPAVVHVEDIERAGEIMALCDKNKWQVIVGIEPDKPEDISDIERLMNPPKPFTKTIDVGRNEPCPCGSGKKYKHCCMNHDINYGNQY